MHMLSAHRDYSYARAFLPPNGTAMGASANRSPYYDHKLLNNFCSHCSLTVMNCDVINFELEFMSAKERKLHISTLENTGLHDKIPPCHNALPP